MVVSGETSVWSAVSSGVPQGSILGPLLFIVYINDHKVPHARLLVKLKALGGNDQVSSWIEEWLTDRRQRVVVSGETSVWSAVSSRMPQGSILGPLLFIVYINDLDEEITSTVLKFADDTKISSNSQQELQRDLDIAVEWAQT